MSFEADYTPTGADERLMWDYMQATLQFSHEDLRQATGVADFPRRRFLTKLRRKGLLHDCGRRDKKTLMTVKDDEAVQRYAAQKRRTPEGMMWSAMRSMKEFTPPDILTVLVDDNATVELPVIQKYCQMLLRADYLIVMEKARPGVRPARYRLVKDTGPLPVIEKMVKATIDGNEERVIRIMGQTL